MTKRKALELAFERCGRTPSQNDKTFREALTARPDYLKAWDKELTPDEALHYIATIIAAVELLSRNRELTDNIIATYANTTQN